MPNKSNPHGYFSAVFGLCQAFLAQPKHRYKILVIAGVKCLVAMRHHGLVQSQGLILAALRYHG